MRIREILIAGTVLVATAGPSAAGEDGAPAPIDAERAAALLVARLPEAPSLSRTLRYVCRIEATGSYATTAPGETRCVRRGDLLSGDASVVLRKRGDDRPVAVSKQCDGARYFAGRADDPEFDWSAWRDHAAVGGFRSVALDPVQAYARPALHLAPRDLLRSYPPAEAVADGEAIVVVLRLNASVRELVSSGNPLSGCPGFRVRFERFDSAYCVTDVDQLETVRTLEDDGRGGSVWADNPRLLRDLGECVVLGRVRCGVAQRTSFRRFRRFGEAVVPLEMENRTCDGSVRATVDDASVEFGPALAGDFAFEPPVEMGARGCVLDLRTGRTEYVGFRPTPDAAIERLVARGPGGRPASPEPVPWTGWIGLSAGLSAAVLGAVALRRRERGSGRRAASAPDPGGVA